MRILSSKKAELFDKAFGDLWSAEQIYKGRPDYAVWHCEQCVEKLLKGILLCNGKQYDHTHDILALLEECMDIHGLSIEEDLQEAIVYINRFGNAIRYKNRKDDPNAEDANAVIQKTRLIMENVSAYPQIVEPFREAKQLFHLLLEKL